MDVKCVCLYRAVIALCFRVWPTYKLLTLAPLTSIAWRILTLAYSLNNKPVQLVHMNPGVDVCSVEGGCILKKGCLFLNPWKFSLNLFWSSYVALKTNIDITLSSIAFNIFKVIIWRRDGRIPIWCTHDHGHDQRLSVHLNLWWAYWSLFFKGGWLMSIAASVRASLAGSFASCRTELSQYTVWG